MNLRSGSASTVGETLVDAARDRGITVRVLGENDDLAALALEADTDVLGMAGGDGSLGVVAAVAIDRDLPFVCIPMGTRNHFASDARLPVDDPLEALAAFDDGVEIRVDVGRADGRLFLNNVSLGVYARLVHRRERRRRRGDALARMRALVASLPDRSWSQRFRIDGEYIRASIVLVANNEYDVDLSSLGSRSGLDNGVLALYAARGLRRLGWTERTATSIVVETRRPMMHAAVDGEPTRFASPLRLQIEPGALRLLVPELTAAEQREDEGAQNGDAGGDSSKNVEQVVRPEQHSARGHD